MEEKEQIGWTQVYCRLEGRQTACSSSKSRLQHKSRFYSSRVNTGANIDTLKINIQKLRKMSD